MNLSLKCSICEENSQSRTFCDLKIFYNHVYRHSCEKNFVIKCCIGQCADRFSKYKSLRTHMQNKHFLKLDNSIEDPKLQTNIIKQIKCSSCAYKSHDLTEFRMHFLKHFNDYDALSCFYQNCNYSTKSRINFNSHHSKLHRQATLENVKHNLITQTENESEPIEECDVQATNAELDEERILTDETNEEMIEQPMFPNQNPISATIYLNDSDHVDLRNFYVRTYTKFEDVKLIPKSTCDEIFDDIDEFIRLKDVILKKNIIDNLKVNGVDENIRNAIENQIRFGNTFAEIHRQFKGDKQKQDFIQASNFFVSPKEILLGEDEMRKYTFHYIPIKETLKANLMRKDILDEQKTSIWKN